MRLSRLISIVELLSTSVSFRFLLHRAHMSSFSKKELSIRKKTDGMPLPLNLSAEEGPSTLSLEMDFAPQDPHTNAKILYSRESAIEADEDGREVLSSLGEAGDIPSLELQETAPRAARKAAKKLAKAQRRAKREGRADNSVGQKTCDTCSSHVDLLIRCQVDESKAWKMVCGKCWKTVSGGTVDGDANHPHYKYGGLWKNRK